MAFLPVAQGLGRAGNEWSQATDQNLDRALKLIQSKLMIQEIQQRIKESQSKMQQAQAPQPYGMVGTPGGGTAGVTFDPTKGTFGQQPIIPDLPPGKYPTFKTLPEASIWAIEHGDEGLLKKIEEHQRATQKPTAEHPTPYSDWRKANPNAPVSQWLAEQKKYRGKEGGGGEDSEGLEALADLIESGETKMPTAGKTAEKIAKILKKRGTHVPKQLSADEKKGVDTINQALPLLDQSLEMLKGMKDDNSITSGLRSRGYWAMYNQGIAPPEPFASYFQMAALMRVLLLAPYLHGIRNPEFVKQIQQHMPNPEKDTPKFMYDKAQKLRPVMEKMVRQLEGKDSAASATPQIPSGSVAVKDESGNIIGSATPEQQQKGTYTPF